MKSYFSLIVKLGNLSIKKNILAFAESHNTSRFEGNKGSLVLFYIISDYLFFFGIIFSFFDIVQSYKLSTQKY